MRVIEVRNVPGDLHRALEARAGRDGVTLSDLILAELPRLAARPSAEEVVGRIRRRTRWAVRRPPRSFEVSAVGADAGERPANGSQ